jgi:hypothetical protein
MALEIFVTITQMCLYHLLNQFNRKPFPRFAESPLPNTDIMEFIDNYLHAPPYTWIAEALFLLLTLDPIMWLEVSLNTFVFTSQLSAYLSSFFLLFFCPLVYNEEMCQSKNSRSSTACYPVQLDKWNMQPCPAHKVALSRWGRLRTTSSLKCTQNMLRSTVVPEFDMHRWRKTIRLSGAP